MDMQTRAVSHPSFLFPCVYHGRAELPCCRTELEDGGMKRKGTASFAISPLLQVSLRDSTVRSGVSIQNPVCPQIPACPPVQLQPQWPCASSIFNLSLCDTDPSPHTCHTVAVQSVGKQTWKMGDLVKWSLRGSLKDTESLVTAWQPLPWVVGSAHSPLPGLGLSIVSTLWDQPCFPWSQLPAQGKNRKC